MGDTQSRPHPKMHGNTFDDRQHQSEQQQKKNEEQQPEQNCTETGAQTDDDGDHLLLITVRQMVTALTERLDGNVDIISKLQSDVRALEEGQTNAVERHSALNEEMCHEVEQRCFLGDDIANLTWKLTDWKEQNQRKVTELLQDNQRQWAVIKQIERDTAEWRNYFQLKYDRLNNAVVCLENRPQQDVAYLKHMVEQCAKSVADLRADKIKEMGCQNQQQNVEKLKKTVDELICEQRDICTKLSGLVHSVGFLKGLVPYNRWDPSACHKDLALFGSGRLIVKYSGEGPGEEESRGKGIFFIHADRNGLQRAFVDRYRSVFAKWPVTKNNFNSYYFEITIVEKLSWGDIAMGLAAKQMLKLNKLVAHYKHAYAYDSSGNIWENGGRLKHRGRHSSECGRGGGAYAGKRVPMYGQAGDVIGCGINLDTRHIIYTKNGDRIDASSLSAADSAFELFSCVTLCHPGDKIEANFGPNFKYNAGEDI